MSGANDPYDPKRVAALSDEAIAAAVSAARAALADALDLDALHDAFVAHLGDRSPLALANREIGALPPAARSEAGQRVNRARGALRAEHVARQAELEAARDVSVLAAETVDVTLPFDRRPVGARHPLTTLQERIEDLFVAMGYEVAEGPEIESEWFNFDALNMDADHPARSMMDTFFVSDHQVGEHRATKERGAEPIDGTVGEHRATTERAAEPIENDLAADDASLVLRTHTSPVQARTMLTRTPPIYVICPGRVFRTDELDATHSPVFHQIEGLVIDEGITMADLKGTLDHFATAMFGEGIVTRLRPSYFPFTEPSAEPDLLCFVCRGQSVGNPDWDCRTCSNEGWIEWGGCGMVNPRVLRACGIDPQRYSGFAFGMGVERTMMFRNNAADMRDLVEGDVRFTQAFGMEA